MCSRPSPRMRRASSLRALFLAATLAGAAEGSLHAQTPDLASVAGTITGESGPLAQANVLLLLNNRTVRHAVTDSSGTFRWVSIPPDGDYVLAVSRLGYRTRRLYAFVLEAGQARTVALALELAPVLLPGVSAEATGVKVDTRSAAVSMEIPQLAVQLMPLAHDPKEAVRLTPGARPEQVWGGSNIQANNYQIDGLAANHPGLGGDLVEPSLNWIERIEVKGLGAGAEYGNFQGGIVNIVTKRGTNERQGSFRSTLESHLLNGSNLVRTEIGSEVDQRYDLAGDVGGPIVRDRLFYFLAGDVIRRDARAQNHFLGGGRYIGEPEAQRQTKLFGKLTWKPGVHDVVEGSAGRLDDNTDRYQLTGYETPAASWRYRNPTTFGSFSWTRVWAGWSTTEAKLNAFDRNERQLPYAGQNVPGMQFFALRPPALAFDNAPVTLTHHPTSLSGSLTWSLGARVGGLEQVLKLGLEESRGTFTDQRTRNGALTWRPTRRAGVDPADPTTWPMQPEPFIATTWGGEVDLHAQVENTAAFAQGTLALGPRLVLTPGIRWGRWSGWLLPHGAASERFLALRDNAWDPRLGLVANPLGDGSLLAKVHWGRYHQSMVAQFFDRVQGGDVFSNEETWFYYGPSFTDPAKTFTIAQRDSLASSHTFVKQSEIVLNETGKVGAYRQPYVDQWVVSLEKAFGTAVKMKATYVKRANHDMVAVVDVNAGSNYTAFDNVTVLDPDGNPLAFSGGNVFLNRVYLPNFVLKQRLLCKADGSCPDGPHEKFPLPPGMSIADTAHLTWNPQYVLTNAPNAERRFDQLQLVLELAQPTWGGNLSWVLTRLKGNLDNVSGYDDPSQYSAGPYVRVNEGVNAYGYLPNFSGSELKVSVYGMLPGKLRGGVYYTEANGDHYSPVFTLSGMGFYRYMANRSATGNWLPWSGGSIAPPPPIGGQIGGQELDYRFFWPLEGHNQFTGPRGAPTMPSRTRLDVHLEREVPWPVKHASVLLDVFNVANSGAPTRLNPSVNNGINYFYFLAPQGGSYYPPIDPNQYYEAVLQRVPPRTVRLGVSVAF